MTDPSDILSPETEILIVDDNTQYTLVLRKILQSVFGYSKITAAINVQEAYKVISADPERFKLLFVDYNFPSGESGNDLLRRLHTEQLLGGKAAFLITSEPTIDNMNEAIAAGALGVVAKPFDRTELKKQLEKAMRAKALDSGESF